MSRFFRTGSSSEESDSTSEEEEENTEEILNQSLSQLPSPEFSGASLESIAVDRSDPNAQDFLVHALLEERCRNEVLKERNAVKDPRRRLTDDEVQQESQRRYQRLCAQLAPMNLVAQGLEQDRHGATRQRVRDGLNRLQQSGAPQPSFPGPLRRLLTDSTTQDVAPFDGLASFHQPVASRYLKDYDELGVLGRGGYGEVFHVRHRLDACLYAVKKIPIRPSMVRRIATEGNAVLDEILVEVRSLSRLDHPNVVRYHHSWIEWSSGSSFIATSSDDGPSETRQSADAVSGAADEVSASSAFESLHRVRTESTTVEDMDIGFTFESRSQHSTGTYHTNDSPSRSDSDAGPLSTTESVLALHMQMDVYPMTLADFLSPKTTGPVKPLAHCFHLEPSLQILLAVLDGVEYIHSEGIVHRDLKPANIFLRPESSTKSGCVDLFKCSTCQADNAANPATLGVRIGDFGLVANIAQTGNISTSEPVAVGTEIYRPVSTKSNISPRLDIFALGVIACELLCKFNTQMERRETLHALKKGRFPERFASCAGGQAGRVKECVAAMLGDGMPEEGAIADLRQRIEAILASKAIGVEVSFKDSSPLRRSST
uniref:Protein kinase domain-containing protein n=1 Tax=Ramularia collo-cygni TaxID=112498 RepID=A0A2D3VE31_9PEZI